MRFRKKPVEVEAVQWTEDTSQDIAEFAKDANGNSMIDVYKVGTPSEFVEVYDSLQRDWIHVNRGDWIVKGIRGEFYPVADDVFRETYDPC